MSDLDDKADSVGGWFGEGLVGGLTGQTAADASRDAANASAAGAKYAADIQKQMFDLARGDQAGQRFVGGAALNKLASIYGLPQYEAKDPANALQYEPGGDLFRLNNRTPMVNELLYQNDPIYRQAWDETSRELGFRDPKIGSYETDKTKLATLLRQKMEANPAYAARISSSGQGGTTYDNATGQPVKNNWSSFFDSPDYQFSFDEGQRAANSSLAARGLGNSGAALKELTRYGQGAASQQLNRYVDRLASLAGIGTSAAESGGNQAIATGQGIGNAMQAGADARASGYMGAANAQTAGAGNMAGIGIGLLSALCDVRMKRDIEPLYIDVDGLIVSSFRYKGHAGLFVGKMAQDVQKIDPENVIEQDGVLFVTEKYAPVRVH